MSPGHWWQVGTAHVAGLLSLRPPPADQGGTGGPGLAPAWGSQVGRECLEESGGRGSLAAHSAPPSGPVFSKVSVMTGHGLCCTSSEVYGTISHAVIKTHSTAGSCPCPESNPQPGPVGSATREPLTASLAAQKLSRPSEHLVSRKTAMMPIFPPTWSFSLEKEVC